MPYVLQLSLKEKYSTNHTLINIIENYKEALDDRCFGCRIFVDAQKAFVTVDHKGYIEQDYYVIRSIANN